MGTSTQSWKREDRLDTAMFFPGKLSGAFFKPLQHPESSSPPATLAARPGADHLPLGTRMEDFSCPFDTQGFGTHCYSSCATILFMSIKTHTNHLHFTSLHNLLTAAASPRLRTLNVCQNSLHCTVAPDFSWLYQDKTHQHQDLGFLPALDPWLESGYQSWPQVS